MAQQMHNVTIKNHSDDDSEDEVDVNISRSEPVQSDTPSVQAEWHCDSEEEISKFQVSH